MFLEMYSILCPLLKLLSIKPLINEAQHNGCIKIRRSSIFVFLHYVGLKGLAIDQNGRQCQQKLDRQLIILGVIFEKTTM